MSYRFLIRLYDVDAADGSFVGRTSPSGLSRIINISNTIL